jgi:hypothetical protein
VTFRAGDLVKAREHGIFAGSLAGQAAVPVGRVGMVTEVLAHFAYVLFTGYGLQLAHFMEIEPATADDLKEQECLDALTG